MTETDASPGTISLVEAGHLLAGAAHSLADDIRSAGLKVTAPRLAVLRTLTENPHASADQVFAAVRADLPGTSVQAVYGVLGAFGAAGLVRRIEPAGSAALFERRVGDNHHHLICSRCNVVRDVDCAIGEAPCLEPGDAAGFAVTTAEVTFWGLCPECQKAPERSAAPFSPST